MMTGDNDDDEAMENQAEEAGETPDQENAEETSEGPAVGPAIIAVPRKRKKTSKRGANPMHHHSNKRVSSQVRTPSVSSTAPRPKGSMYLG
jgi:hypothetical protein